MIKLLPEVQGLVLNGDCLQVLKELEDNSVDSIVTDPPYALGFMGKSWDTFDKSQFGKKGLEGENDLKIKKNFEVLPRYNAKESGFQEFCFNWAKECLRVLKPGGHLLSFGGTRTYHRMACAIEDAGFEVRDMIEWTYGSGFPKSLNIGKAVDKLQGNEREDLGYNDNSRTNTPKVDVYEAGIRGKESRITKGTSDWEGWGTAMKPSHEPICMARKPLSDGGLDIVKAVCCDMIEKGLYRSDDNEILWRIKLVKDVEKQKILSCSDLIRQQKMAVVSVKSVKTNKNVCVGKEILMLLENMQRNGEKEILKEQGISVQNTMEQIKNEFHNIGKPININENKIQLENMGGSVNVVEKQDLSSLPLTTLMAVEENTEKNLNTETFISSLKKQDTQKKDLGCSVVTATSQWVCMDIVRIIKINFENKEYEFEQLSDGSFIWNNKLKPFREPRTLNVAENVLKYGTGGINIDESRVGTETIISNGGRKNNMAGDFRDEKGAGMFAGGKPNLGLEHQGRFPANLIHDGSEEVLKEFEKAGISKGNGHFPKNNKNGNSIFNTNNLEQEEKYLNDSGTPARFFKQCEFTEEDFEYAPFFYCAKASKSERNRGCEELEEKVGIRTNAPRENEDIKTPTRTNNHPTVKPIALMEYLIKMVTPKGGVVLDPFAGSGTTLVASKKLGYKYIGIELTKEYIPIINARLESVK